MTLCKFIYPLWLSVFPSGKQHLAHWVVGLSEYMLRRVQLFVTLWAVVHRVLLSMGFSWQEYWSGLSFPPPGHLPDPGIEPMSLAFPALQVDPLSLVSFLKNISHSNRCAMSNVFKIF